MTLSTSRPPGSLKPDSNIPQTLLAKTFIEGGQRDIEDFKALEKCFNQEHRGPEAHAHFMRPWSQRYAISPHRHDKSDPTPEVHKEAPLEESAATLIVTPPDAEPPPTPTARKPQPSPTREVTPKSEKKKKSKAEKIAERHTKRPKHRDGPTGNVPPKQNKSDDKAPSGAPKAPPSTPGANGKIVMFVRPEALQVQRFHAKVLRCLFCTTRQTASGGRWLQQWSVREEKNHFQIMPVPMIC